MDFNRLQRELVQISDTITNDEAINIQLPTAINLFRIREIMLRQSLTSALRFVEDVFSQNPWQGNKIQHGAGEGINEGGWNEKAWEWGALDVVGDCTEARRSFLCLYVITSSRKNTNWKVSWHLNFSSRTETLCKNSHLIRFTYLFTLQAPSPFPFVWPLSLCRFRSFTSF